MGVYRDNFHEFVDYYAQLLERNLESHEPFDASKPYVEKNKYADADYVNNAGQFLLQYDPRQAEVFYRKMLNVTVEHKHETGRYFHRGYFLANLGIAQIRNGKYDQGIAHMLAAETEDKKHPEVSQDWSILNTFLWEQFELPVIYPTIRRIIALAEGKLSFLVNDELLTSFFKSLETQDRIYLQRVLIDWSENYHLYTEYPNVYTAGRLYLVLKDISSLAETFLRKKQLSEGIINSGDQITLQNLIKNALGSKIAYPNSSLNCWANYFEQFLARLEVILDDSMSVELKSVHCLQLCRNFTVHHFDFSNDVKSPEDREFFSELYGKTLAHVIIALLYFNSPNRVKL